MSVDLPPPPPALVWNAPAAGNPIIAGYFADPSLVQHEGNYFLYATLDPWGGDTLGCWESSDFKTWTYRVLNWPTKLACTSPTSKGAKVWAPSVVKGPDGKFHLFISVGSEVWVGVADHPLGPWRDANGGRPLIPATWNPTYHMIDAEAFIDDDGRAYLYWGSGWNWKNGRCFVVELNRELNAFISEPRDVTPEAGHYFEGPFMVKHAGRYYLTYSDGQTPRDNYCVYYAVGDSPLGPFRETKSTPILATDHARNIVSPGHHAVFTRDGQPYVLYHRQRIPFVMDTAYRQLCVDPLVFTPDGEIADIIPTHAGPAFVQRPPSLAARATVSASATVDPIYAPATVVDENYATRWRVPAGTENPWLQLDLGNAHEITAQSLRFEYAWQRYHFLAEAPLDGINWSTVADFRETGATGSPVLIAATLKARYLRLAFAGPTPPEGIALFEWDVR